MESSESKKKGQTSVRKGKAYPSGIRMAAVRDYLSGMSRKSVAEKYSLPDASILSHWKRTFVEKSNRKEDLRMKGKVKKPSRLLTESESDLLKRIRELERELRECRKELDASKEEARIASLRALISETMVDVAEEEFDIDIRKKFGSR